MKGFEGRSYVDSIPKCEKAKRFVWNIVWFFLFRPSPRWALNRWRLFLLRSFGAKIDRGSRILPSCYVWAPWNLTMGAYSVLADDVKCYSMASIIIGDRVTVSQGAYLCAGTHDISSLRLPLITRPIVLNDFSWVCAEAFIGPGNSVGEGAVVAARAVVVTSVESWDVVGGNPTRIIKKRIIKPEEKE